MVKGSRWCWWLSVVLMTACPTLGPPEALVPGAVVIDERVMEADTFHRTTLGAEDLLVDGDRMWLVHYRYEAGGLVEHPDYKCPACTAEGGYVGSTMSTYVAVSENGGATWKTQPVDWPWAFVMGLFRAGDRWFVQGEQVQTGAGNNTYWFYELRELNPQTLAVIENPALSGVMLSMPLRDRGGVLSSAFGSAPSNSTVYELWRDTFDVETASLKREHVLAPRQDCHPQLHSQDGRTFTGYCLAPQPLRGCRVDVGASGLTPSSTCAGIVNWPMEFLEGASAFGLETSAGPVWVSGKASPQTGGAVLTMRTGVEVDAGVTWHLPSMLPPVLPTAVHDQFAGLVPLEDGRYAELQPDGDFEVLEFPPTPCVGAEACAFSRIHWLHPRADGRYLVIYGSDTKDHHQRLVAVELAPKRTLVPAPTPPIANYAGAAVPPPIDRFCLLAHSCKGIQYGECVGFLAGILVNPMGDPTRFANARTCEEALAAWPGLAKVGRSCTPPPGGGYVCIDSMRGYCFNNITYAFDECSSANTLTCDGTKSCYPSKRQIETCYAETQGKVRCENGVLKYPCSTGPLEHDCNFLGAPCSETTTGGCDLPPFTQTTLCREFGFQCDGPDLVYCMGGAFRRLDCRDFGKTRCVSSSSMEARCE